MVIFHSYVKLPEGTGCFLGNVPHSFLLRKNGVTVISETSRTVVGVTMADKAIKTGRG